MDKGMIRIMGRHNNTQSDCIQERRNLLSVLYGHDVTLESSDSWQISKGDRVRYMAAFADDPPGPFRKHDEPIFELKGSEAEGSYMMGEVIGKAASICVKEKTSPRGVYEKHLSTLQALMKQPGKKRVS